MSYENVSVDSDGVFTLLHFPAQEDIESMGDIGNRDTSCRREGTEKRKFPSGGL